MRNPPAFGGLFEEENDVAGRPGVLHHVARHFGNGGGDADQHGGGKAQLGRLLTPHKARHQDVLDFCDREFRQFRR